MNNFEQTLVIFKVALIGERSFERALKLTTIRRWQSNNGDPLTVAESAQRFSLINPLRSSSPGEISFTTPSAG